MNKVLKREDLGNIEFGIYKGKKWSELPEDYLKYIKSDECRTSDLNKMTATKEMHNRTFRDGQIELFPEE